MALVQKRPVGKLRIAHLRVPIPIAVPRTAQSRGTTNAPNSRMCLRGCAGAENREITLFE